MKANSVVEIINDFIVIQMSGCCNKPVSEKVYKDFEDLYKAEAANVKGIIFYLSDITKFDSQNVGRFFDIATLYVKKYKLKGAAIIEKDTKIGIEESLTVSCFFNYVEKYYKEDGVNIQQLIEKLSS